MTTNKSQWDVTWNWIGQSVGGTFGSIGTAQSLASLDWDRDVGDFETGEVQEAVRLANRYRRQVGARRVRVRIEENREGDI